MKKISEIIIVCLLAFTCIMCNTDENVEVFESSSLITEDLKTFLPIEQLATDQRFVLFIQNQLDISENTKSFENIDALLIKENPDTNELEQIAQSFGFKSRFDLDTYNNHQLQLFSNFKNDYDLSALSKGALKGVIKETLSLIGSEKINGIVSTHRNRSVASDPLETLLACAEDCDAGRAECLADALDFLNENNDICEGIHEAGSVGLADCKAAIARIYNRKVQRCHKTYTTCIDNCLDNYFEVLEAEEAIDETYPD